MRFYTAMVVEGSKEHPVNIAGSPGPCCGTEIKQPNPALRRTPKR
jgi:hypothetical protein